MVLENSKVIVDIDSCTKCRACTDECHYYYFEADNLSFDGAMEEYCIECGKCVAICPVNAIKLKIHKDKSIKDVPNKENLPSSDHISGILTLMIITETICTEKSNIPPITAFFEIFW